MILNTLVLILLFFKPKNPGRIFFPVLDVTRSRNPHATGKPGGRLLSDRIFGYPINLLYRMGWKYSSIFDYKIQQIVESGEKITGSILKWQIRLNLRV